MKSRKLKVLEKILRWMAIAVIRKYKPKVVGITGSVGKTSAKEAAFLILSSKFRTRKNEKNYNNEIGIPLTIIGSETGNKSVWKWMKVFFRWLALAVLPAEYPEVLVLEMAVDRPGDMKYLTEFVPVNISVVTSVSSNHLEFFKDIDHIAREKGRMVETVSEKGTIILNADDERVISMKEKSGARVISYGLGENAAVTASNVTCIYEEEKPIGLSFKINYEGKSIPMRLKKIIAPYQIYAVLAGVSAGIAMKINLVDIVKSLEEFISPAGRMNLIEGINTSQIIDDTYNSSPASAVAALSVLQDLRSYRKIAVLGDMLELGAEENKSHRAVARKAFELNVNLFFAVGDRMKIAVRELENLGYPPDRIFHFDDPVSAGEKLKDLIVKGDLVLVKGSQSMRMEKIVEKVMHSPEKSRDLLCRQSEEWWKKPYIKP